MKTSLYLGLNLTEERYHLLFFVLSLFLLLTGSLAADPGAKLVIPDSEAWTGQRIPIFVELRAEGSFKGAASFDLPEIPRTVVIKVGSPILSSETSGDTEIFIQRHEFALFSQADGTLKLPPITARFSHTKGYTGPVFDTSSKTEAAKLTLKRPPNSESLGFIVTTGSLGIEESWDPTPGPLETGTVLKRTIVQRAKELTAIALKPAPTPEIEGIRTYTGNPEVTDKTERGEFLGERRETITYLVQQAGLHSLPEIRYDWWNPKTKTLESKTLASVSFTATAPPLPPAKRSPLGYIWLIPIAVALCLVAFGHQHIANGCHRFHEWIDPPQKRAARRFIKACRLNEPAAAATAWSNYRKLHPNHNLSEELKRQIQELHSHIYGTTNSDSRWSSEALVSAFRQSLHKFSSSTAPSHLPELNP